MPAGGGRREGRAGCGPRVGRRLPRRVKQGLLCLGWCRAVPSWLRDPPPPPGPSRSLPFRTVGPAAISGPSDQAPVSPFHPGTLLCAPLKMDSVSCSEAPTGGSHGRRSRTRAWDLQVQCVSSVHSLDFGDHIPAVRWPAFHACCQAGRPWRGGPGPPELNHGWWQDREERPALTPSLDGWNWRELGRAQLSRGHPVPFTQASVGRRH